MGTISSKDLLFIDEISIRKQLKSFRRQKKLTLEQASELSGLSVSTVQSLESRTDVGVYLKTILTYADSLGYDILLKKRRNDGDESWDSEKT